MSPLVIFILPAGLLAASAACFAACFAKWPLLYFRAHLNSRDAAENVSNLWDADSWGPHRLKPWFCAECGWRLGQPALPATADACPACRRRRIDVGRVALNDGTRFFPPRSVPVVGAEPGRLTVVNGKSLEAP